MQDYKWTKRLSRSTISNVLACSPESVEFTIDRRNRTVECTIHRYHDHGYGLAICSCLDEFNVPRGKTIAANRAVLALTEKVNSRSVRQRWELFPDTWTKKRIDRLKSFRGVYKCQYGYV